ncbi:MAG: hypothetical protein QN648_06250 [Nitrososphaeraceae archaeon]|nr:hypothetical protein [Nitrososphaeraceae archaeon]MDW0260400.1 hypothetical protein [Nitrososphaeraceae archaeon]
MISNLEVVFSQKEKISKSYKNQILSALKHVCEMNYVVLNWKKLKKFIKSEKTDNEANGRYRNTHEKIEKELGFCDQSIRKHLCFWPPLVPE